MSNCPNCGNHGMRNGEYCSCVFGVQKAIHDGYNIITGTSVGEAWKSVLTSTESQ